MKGSRKAGSQSYLGQDVFLINTKPNKEITIGLQLRCSGQASSFQRIAGQVMNDDGSVNRSA